jgi:hypothetical protein
MIVPPSALPFIRQQRTGVDPARYGEVIAAEFAEIEPHLPEAAATIIDIGCGVAGIGVHLHRRYPGAQLYLVDRTERAARVPYGYGDGSFYNSLEAAGELLIANGVPADRVSALDPAGELPPADLVVSLLAWGFHLPVETYLPRLRLNPGAVVVLDIRIGTDGHLQLARVLRPGAVIRRDSKRERIAWTASAGMP